MLGDADVVDDLRPLQRREIAEHQHRTAGLHPGRVDFVGEFRQLAGFQPVPAIRELIDRVDRYFQCGADLSVRHRLQQLPQRSQAAATAPNSTSVPESAAPMPLVTSSAAPDNSTPLPGAPVSGCWVKSTPIRSAATCRLHGHRHLGVEFSQSVKVRPFAEQGSPDRRSLQRKKRHRRSVRRAPIRSSRAPGQFGRYSRLHPALRTELPERGGGETETSGARIPAAIDRPRGGGLGTYPGNRFGGAVGEINNRDIAAGGECTRVNVPDELSGVRTARDVSHVSKPVRQSRAFVQLNAKTRPSPVVEFGVLPTRGEGRP